MRLSSTQSPLSRRRRSSMTPIPEFERHSQHRLRMKRTCLGDAAANPSDRCSPTDFHERRAGLPGVETPALGAGPRFHRPTRRLRYVGCLGRAHGFAAAEIRSRCRPAAGTRNNPAAWRLPVRRFARNTIPTERPWSDFGWATRCIRDPVKMQSGARRRPFGKWREPAPARNGAGSMAQIISPKSSRE